MTKIRARIDTHLVLNTEDMPSELILELQEEYTKSNPEFHKKKAMGFWLGATPRKICSWSREGKMLILPRGALANAKKLAAKFDRDLEINDCRLRLPKTNFRPSDRSVLRSYQETAVTKLIEADCNGTIRGPCGSGKTVVLIAAIARLQQPTLVVVHSKALAQQWRAAILAWLGVIAGSIEGGKIDIKPITIATQQSLWKAIESKRAGWISKFGALVGDEIHHWAAKTFQTVVTAFPAAHRFGASADERRKDGLEHLIYEAFGEPVAEIEKDDLIKLGKLLPTHLDIVKTGYCDNVYCDSVRAKEVPDWVRMINKLTEDEDRNDLILALVLSLLETGFQSSGCCEACASQACAPKERCSKCKTIPEELFCTCRNTEGGFKINRSLKTLMDQIGVNAVNVAARSHDDRAIHGVRKSILILNDRVEACRRLAARLAQFGVKVGLLLGGPSNRKELEESIVGLRSGLLDVGVGTTVADEGLDIPRLTHVLITCPVHKHPKRLEQMIGRAARPFEGKKEAVCVYLWDEQMFPVSKKGERVEDLEIRKQEFLRKLAKVAASFSVR